MKYESTNIREQTKLLDVSLRKIIRWHGRKYFLIDILKLLKEKKSLTEVSKVTEIPLYKLRENLIRKLGLSISQLKREVDFIVTKEEGKLYTLKQIVRLFKKYGFLPYVSKITGMPAYDLRKILVKKFGIGLTELRNKLGIQKTCLNTRDLEKHASRYQQVKELYGRLGTYEKVGKELNLTRERVRQILKKGKELHLFSYRTRSQAKKLNFRQLKQRLTREDLIKEIKMLCSMSKICLKFNVDKQQLIKLLEYFSIDLQEYKNAARMGKYIQEYSIIVDSLGYHPTTTELNSRKEWRRIWIGITRYWRNIGNFRKEFGIEKPKMRIHPNTLKAWNDALQKRIIMKRQKTENLLQLIKDYGPIKLRDICEKIDSNMGTAWKYIHELLDQGRIIKVGRGNKVKYMINQEQPMQNTIV